MEITLMAKGLSKMFGRLVAVDHLYLEIHPGEIYGLVGANGAGKTTTVRMLCGVVRPTEGEIFLLGRKMPDASVFPHIGYMPQDLALYVDLTVQDHIVLFGELYGLGRKELRKRQEEVLALVGLEGWESYRVFQLSGGMKRRLSLACSLLHEPVLLFLDEPTVGIDPELRAVFWDYFRYLKGVGKTLLITTHSMEEAQRCDRIGFIHNGKLLAEDTPYHLVARTGASSLEEAFLQLLKEARA